MLEAGVVVVKTPTGLWTLSSIPILEIVWKLGTVSFSQKLVKVRDGVFLQNIEEYTKKTNDLNKYTPKEIFDDAASLIPITDLLKIVIY